MIFLQSRDKKILELAYEHQFVVTDQIRLLFQNHSYKEAAKRLKQLEQTGFLKRDASPILGKQVLFRLTRQGKRITENDRTESLKQVTRVNPITLVHDSIVTGVRLRLEALWDATFIAERDLKVDEFKEVPDGVFRFASGRAIALEIENSDKGRSRFQRLLSRWDAVPSVTFVLYIATSPKLFEILKKYIVAASNHSPIGLVEWDALREGVPNIWTKAGEIDLLKRRSF